MQIINAVEASANYQQSRKEAVEKAHTNPLKQIFIGIGRFGMGAGILAGAGWLADKTPWYVFVPIGFFGLLVAAPNLVAATMKVFIGFLKDIFAVIKPTPAP